MYGSGLRSHTVSTSDTRMSKPISVNRWISSIFLRPILWKFAVPQPKSFVVSPLCMANVGTSSSMSFSSNSLSIAPTM